MIKGQNKIIPKFPKNSLYFVSSEEYSQGKKTLEIAYEAVEGGIDILQMREKNKNEEKLIFLGKKLAELCKINRVTFIVNDNPKIAKKVDADGVHLGQEDCEIFTIEETRKLLGRDKIIGLSTHSLEQFTLANEMDLDYIAFGPIFSTKTKEYYIGLENIESVLKIAKKPVVFIGGINLENIDLLIQKGVQNIAMIRGITKAKNVKTRIKNLKLRMKS